MSRQLQTYLSEEDEEEKELIEFIDRHKDMFGGESNMIKHAIKVFEEEKRDELESINTDSGTDTLI